MWNSNYTDVKGNFIDIVKAGEVYSVDEAMLDERNGFIFGRDDRPRGIKSGTNKGCGIMASL